MMTRRMVGWPDGPRWRFAAALAALAVAPLLVSPVALNLVNLTVLNPGSSVSRYADAEIALAKVFAWGPFVVRTWNAEAALAHQRGDVAAELTLLGAASAAAPWDASLAARLAELRLAQGDRPGAIRAWQTNLLLIKIPLSRGIVSSDPATALDWFGAAQAVDPADWRPYAEAAKVLLRSGQPRQAAKFLAEAFRLRSSNAALAVVRQRLLDPFASVDVPSLAPASRGDTALLLQASEVLAAGGDVTGAIAAAEIADRADPANVAVRASLDTLVRRLGRPAP